MTTYTATGGQWVSTVEQRFNQSQPYYTRQGDMVLVPLQAGRHLHTFGFEFKDMRPRSQLMFRTRQHYWLAGKPANTLVSVDEFFYLARQTYQQWYGQSIDDKGLLDWAVNNYVIESDNGNAKIVNGLYMDVDISDASGNVIYNWKKKFVDPNILSGGHSEEDYVWDSIPLDGLDVQPGWHMRFIPVFSQPHDGPQAGFIPLWNFKGIYTPQNSQNVEIRNKNNGWYHPTGGIELPASLAGKKLLAVMIELHDNHGGAYVYLHNGNNVPLTAWEDIKGDKKIQGERQMFALNNPFVIQPGQRIYIGGAQFGTGKGQIEVREIDLYVEGSGSVIPGPTTGGPGVQPPVLPVLGSIRVENPDKHERYVRLLQGDMLQESADFVVISARPGSYNSGLAGYVASKGVNIQQLSQSAAFDGRTYTQRPFPVWISQPLNIP